MTIIDSDFKVVEEPPAICSDPVDYIDFWYSLKAFGESLKNAQLVEYSGMYFRKRKTQLSLCTFDGISGDQVCEEIKELIESGYGVRVWSWSRKDFGEAKMVKKYNEYFIDSGWNFEEVLEQQKNSKSRNKLKNRYKHGEEDYELDGDLKLENIMEMFKDWRQFANERHFMVTIGHYKRYAKLAFEEGSKIQLLGYRDKNENGRIHGVAGWEFAPNGKAQITFMKHRPGDNNFSTYFWVKTLQTISERHNPSIVFCGSTADKLKKRLGMDSYECFTFPMKELKEEINE